MIILLPEVPRVEAAMSHRWLPENWGGSPAGVPAGVPPGVPPGGTKFMGPPGSPSGWDLHIYDNFFHIVFVRPKFDYFCGQMLSLFRPKRPLRVGLRPNFIIFRPKRPLRDDLLVTYKNIIYDIGTKILFLQ